MPSIRALKQAIIGPSIAERHQAIMDEIESRQTRLRESPAIKANLASKRERLRAAENQLPKLSAALRGLSEPHWAAQAETTRSEMRALRREIEDLTAEIAADEAALAEIASAALPEVTPALLAFHRERVGEAQANVDKIATALEAARGELASLSDATGPAADIRRQLEAALSGLAIGATSQEEVDALEVSLTEAESISTITGTKAKRIKATIAGLEDRLTQAQADQDRLAAITPSLRLEALRPELEAAEAAYGQAVASLVSTFDRVRALRHLHSAIRPDSAFTPLPDVAASLKDAGQLRLGEAVEKEQARLESLGF